MPEGDTIYRAARTLHRALAGQTVTRFVAELAPLAQVDRAEPIAGRTIERVEAAGKHCLMTFSGGLVLRSHMRMNGSWHIYRPGEKWQMPARAMRILIETADWVAIAFDVYVAEFVDAADLDRHRPVATLGPDLLGDFDPGRALARIRDQGDRPVHEVLLDQRVMAGLGEAQFAQPGAVDLLRGAREERDTPLAITLAATDPANPYGALLAWPDWTAASTEPRPQAVRASRSAGARVIVVDGRLTAWIGRGDRQMLLSLPADEPDRSRVGRALAGELVALAMRLAGNA